MLMAKLWIHTAGGDKSAILVSAAEEQQQGISYQRDVTELHSLLPADIRERLERRGLIVAPRDIELLLSRLKAARLKGEELRFEIED
jgi:hypothetical protein